MIKQLNDTRIFGIISIMLLVPTLIVLFFIYRYKSTFLNRQFLYITVVYVVVLIFTLYTSTVDVGCSFFPLFVNSLARYIIDVEIMQITTIHLLYLYKLCKHIETRTIQRLQACCCNIRPHLWHEVMIVCIQLGLPLPLLIADIVILKTHINLDKFIVDMEFKYFILPTLAVNILLGLVCTVILVLWFCILKKRKLLKSKAKFVCTQISHILIVLVVLLFGNTTYFYYFYDSFLVHLALRTVAIVSFGVYILISLSSLKRRVTTKAQVPATNRHTNPPSTRVSLPTDTAEHAPNFLSPSTAGPSEVTPLIKLYIILL